MSTSNSSSRVTPVVVAAASAGLVGAFLVWRYGRKAQVQAYVEANKVQESPVLAPKEPTRAQSVHAKEPASEYEDIQVDFCIEGELQQCELTLGVLQCLSSERATGAPAGAMDAALKLLQEQLPSYAQKLKDKRWVVAREAQLEEASEALQLLLLADDERDLEAMAKAGRDIPELHVAVKALQKVLGSAGSNGCCGGKSGGCSSGNGGGCCGGSGDCKSGGCKPKEEAKPCAPGGCNSCSNQASCGQTSEAPTVDVGSGGVVRLAA